jgi:hypothetical protein
MDASNARRSISGRQAIGIVVLVVVVLAVLGLAFGSWTLWVDLG